MVIVLSPGIETGSYLLVQLHKFFFIPISAEDGGIHSVQKIVGFLVKDDGYPNFCS